MREIKVGDAVRCTDVNILNKDYVGKTGIVRRIRDDGSYPYYIAFDDGRGPIWSTAEPLTPENQSGRFKVGDAVRVLGTRKCNGTGIGTVLNIEDNNALYVKIGNSEWYVHPDDAKLIKESTMPTYKDDKYEYTALKSLSPENVLKGNPCKGEFANYVSEFGGQYFFIDIPIEEVVERSKLYPAWLPWLKSHGYVKVEEIEEEMKFERGDIFNIEGTRVMFSRVGDNSFGLIVLDGTFKGSIWSVDQKHYADKLNTEGFKKALGYQSKDYKMIYKTRNKGI